ncbi:hypothetical protein R69608_05081 [Paraburkholderia nemoris]|uniref:hypothetical protein n=1 Tax=Paraburkholderia nemoris TaxID=2793076 RepID=UPI00191159A0|nr:hypothetical protein [Paraburkholderia nemoris]MBK5149712.1 hypothetical protein [Burkholderia sp. R-69608]CAE6938262.1 hypothetical protein R69608_05081 [Paraburkholderia nemoris]
MNWTQVGSVVATSAVTAVPLSFAIVKLALSHQLDKYRIEWEAKTRKEVETILAEHAAKRQYDWEARRRLYQAVGPLRFQLLLACRDLAARVNGHIRREYDTSLANYYGRSFLYRVLRPIAICELVERQMSFADFSVDTDGQILLQFSRAVMAILSGKAITLDYAVDWSQQNEHVFYDAISRAAGALVVREGDTERCMRFAEFNELFNDTAKVDGLHPFPRLFEHFTVSSTPLFWLRLVGYGYVCSELTATVGKDIGFSRRDFDIETLLKAANNEVFNEQMAAYVQILRGFTSYSL